MLKNYSQLITGILIGLALGFLAGKQLSKNAGPGTTVTTNPVTIPERPTENPSSPAVKDNRQVNHLPQKVYDVIKYVRANNQAMPGYVGGRIFSNREELLPFEDNNGKPILYHEWDVNPKIEGQNRGTERIITGSDGRAWYTNDHYRTFKEIK